MPSRAYILSLPERTIRSALGLCAGLLREIGEVVVPRSVRQGQLYRSLVDTTLRYVIEQVAGARGVYPAEAAQTRDFLARRGVGHVIELLGIAAFRVSPVWVFAALADLGGLGRRLIPEIADALKQEGLLENQAQFESVDQLLDGLSKTSARLAQTLTVPPLDVERLRTEWTELRSQARLKAADLPSLEDLGSRWEELKQEAARQGRSVFATSSLMAVSAVRTLPGRARWLSSSARAGAARTGKLLYATIFEDYSRTLSELRELGYASYAQRQLSPYLRACVERFSHRQQSVTERLLGRIRRK
ncbi:MAG TPA: hypothetical protein VET46_01680 [Steroidobacteraceae bacterium]|nr:hypothetical protein [Steroidobacteraceae bacterium]